MHDEADDINGGEHPNPLRFAFVPYQKLLYIFANENVDGLDEGYRFVDGGH